MANISPIRIEGKWAEGYALDFHTVSSTLIGYDEFGHERFDTIRTELGELLYLLKFRSDLSVTEAIVKTASEFVRSKDWPIDIIVPVPPSGPRSIQPVFVLAEALAKHLSVECCIDCVRKTKDTPELKNILDLTRRNELLSEAFKADKSRTNGKNILLFDDLFRSGATMNNVSLSLQGAKNVYALALTKTRTLR